MDLVAELQPPREPLEADDYGPIGVPSVLFPPEWHDKADEETDAHPAELHGIAEVEYDERLCEEKASDFLATINCIMLESETYD